MYKLVLLLITAFLFIAVPSNAQPKLLQKEEKIKELTEKLKLNTEQAAKIKEIYNASEGKIKKVNDKITEQHKKLMNEIKEIVNKEDEQILNLLDKNQKEKFKEIKKERDSRPPINMENEPRGPKPDHIKESEK